MRNIDITEDMLEELESKFDSEDSFEPIIKGLSNSRKDSKHLTDKSDRKREKENRKARKNGKWGSLMNYEMIKGGV